jgi:hypothetical protein
LSSSWCCSSWSISVGVFFFNLFCSGTWFVFRLKHEWVPMLGIPKSEGVPEHESHERKSAIHESNEEEIENLRKLVLTSKVVNPFTRALAPPFIGRRRDFYIPKMPSNLWFLVWTCTWMSFTSRDLRGWFHTFTSLSLVHTPNPDFWGSVFDLASSWFPNPSFMKISAYHNSRISQVSDRKISQVCDSRASQIHDSRASQVHDFWVLQIHDSSTSRVPDSRIPRESHILKQVKSSNTRA